MGAAIETKSKILTMTPTIDTSAYAVGDQLGSLVELTNAVDDPSGTGTIVSVAVLDKSSKSAAMELLLFNDIPTVTSTDNVALNVSDAEMAKCLGSVKVLTTSYIALTANSLASVNGVNLIVRSAKSATNLTGKSIWALLMSSGTPTYVGTTDLVISIGIKQD